MANNGTERAEGFTMVFDDVVRVLHGDSSGALVFGVVWRHSQMRHGYCHASVATMAELCGLSPRTVQRRLQKLKNAELITEVSRAGQHIPTGYRCTYDPAITGARLQDMG